MRKKYKAKKCPRCGTKNAYADFRCCDCGLIFARVENGSNQLAKGLILSGKKDEVVNAPGFPKDVSKKKFLFLCGFLGLFGAHNFYVGRYIKAVFQFVFGCLAVILTVVSGYANIENLMSFVSIPIGIDAVMWLFDFVDGVLNRYKIPVAVDFTDGASLLNKNKG